MRNTLPQFVRDIDNAKRQGRTAYPTTIEGNGISLTYWLEITHGARIALAALRKIKRVGSVYGTRMKTEEAEIAAEALRRINNGKFAIGKRRRG